MKEYQRVHSVLVPEVMEGEASVFSFKPHTPKAVQVHLSIFKTEPLQSATRHILVINH